MPVDLKDYLNIVSQHSGLIEPIMDLVKSKAIAKVTPKQTRFAKNRLKGYAHIDTKNRIDAHLDWLAQLSGPLTPEEQEAAIKGNRGMQDVEFVDGARNSANAVVRLESAFEHGTGFLVAPGILATARHCLFHGSEQFLPNAVLMDENRFISPNGKEFNLTLNKELFYFEAGKDSGEELLYDFVLIGIEGVDDESKASLKNTSWLPLLKDIGKILASHRIYIVHHPNGRRKHISLYGSRLTHLKDEPQLNNLCFYDAHTDIGSSGAPVLSTYHQVIALHQGTVPAVHEGGNLQDIKGQFMKRARVENKPHEVKFIANRGLRASKMVDLLTNHNFKNPDHKVVKKKLLELWAHPKSKKMELKVGWFE